MPFVRIHRKSPAGMQKMRLAKGEMARRRNTKKIEEAISAMFPAARIGRMDRDAMKRRDNYRKILGDFRRGKLDILVGTQMIAKGLDFPRVTLVGIIDADISLHMPDFQRRRKNLPTYSPSCRPCWQRRRQRRSGNTNPKA